jgi:hypothetical protein
VKEVLENLMGFIYSLSMGDYFFFIGTFLLIVLFIYILYLIKCSDVEEKPASKSDSFDIEAACKAIEKDYKPETIKLTNYEEEQENNAIISYEELIKNKDKVSVNYDDEYKFDIPELSVKKIDLNAKGGEKIEVPKMEVRLMSYEKEEDFLKALKELQKNLSH